MKVTTLQEYLAALADGPHDLASRREMARQTYHTLVQCLADGGYATHRLTALPKLRHLRCMTRSRLARWWEALHAWLGRFPAHDLARLHREIVMWKPITEPSAKSSAAPGRRAVARQPAIGRSPSRRHRHDCHTAPATRPAAASRRAVCPTLRD
jgi:hypothetical protein